MAEEFMVAQELRKSFNEHKVVNGVSNPPVATLFLRLNPSSFLTFHISSKCDPTNPSRHCTLNARSRRFDRTEPNK